MTGAIEELQREVTKVLLRALAEAGFALAGAGAIRAHGLTGRPTHDVDLFTGSRSVRPNSGPRALTAMAHCARLATN